MPAEQASFVSKIFAGRAIPHSWNPDLRCDRLAGGDTGLAGHDMSVSIAGMDGAYAWMDQSRISAC